MSRPEDEGGFLSRWARRKQDVHLEEQKAKAAPPANPAETAPEITEPLPLPSLEDVLPGGDVSAFLQKHVPASLR
ncbi:MAG: DUF3306 domain-containing protein, partial [Beijerinckiaceae bacterium]